MKVGNYRSIGLALILLAIIPLAKICNAQDLSVQTSDGTPVINGTSVVDLGPADLGAYASKTFTLINTGTDAIAAINFTPVDPNSSYFEISTDWEVTAPGEETALAGPKRIGPSKSGSIHDSLTIVLVSPFTLPPGFSMTFSVSGRPPNLGPISGTIQILSTNPARPAFTFGVTASGTTGFVELNRAYGSYAGALSGSDGAMTGYLRLTLNKQDSASGVILQGGRRTVVHGAFNRAGKFFGHPSALSLQMSSGYDSPEALEDYFVYGGFTSATGSASIEAWHAGAGGPKFYGFAPNHSAILLDGTASGETAPAGTGFGLLNISAGGYGRFVGRMGDGTPFSFGTPLTTAADDTFFQFIFFRAHLYGAQGFFGGTISLIVSDHYIDEIGHAEWSRPQNQKSAFYPSGFNQTLTVDGGPVYTENSTPITSGTFTLRGGGIPSPLTASIVGSPWTQSLALGLPSYLTTTGAMFSGTLLYPGTNTLVHAFGLIKYGDHPAGGGYFLSPKINGVTFSSAIDVSAPQVTSYAAP
jgi:hypothetical protein